MKLIGFSCNAVPRMPGMRPGDLVTVECEKDGPLTGWRISLRGQQVFLISPPGWQRDQAARRDPSGPLTIFEIPRADITFQWSCTNDELEAFFKGGKFESPPIGAPRAPDEPPLLSKVASSQIGDA